MIQAGARATQEFDDVAAPLLDWLAGLLSAPMSVGAVAACRSCEGRVLFHAIGDELGCSIGIAAMCSAIDSDERDDVVATRLAGVYMRLFEGPGGPATVSLYESTYAGPTRRLNQQATATMEAMLRRCDIAVRADCGEPPDHLALEVALLSTLIRSGERVAAAEMRHRLQRWVPHPAAACADADPTGFYRGALAALHETLLAFDSPAAHRTRHDCST